MANYHIVARVRKWALQDSNLRPSDYESLRGPSEKYPQRRFLSSAQRQTATGLDTSRQHAATPRATHFPHALDRTPLHLLYLVPGLL